MNEIIDIANKQVKKSIFSLTSMIIFFISITIIFKLYTSTIATIINAIFIAFAINDTYKLIIKVKNTKKSLTPIEVKKINTELNNYIFKRPDCILTENYFIVCSSTSFDILKYTDIIMMYYKITFKWRSINRTLNVVTKSNTKYHFLTDTSIIMNENKIKDFSHILTEKNPNILVGKSKENINTLKNSFNIKIK